MTTAVTTTGAAMPALPAHLRAKLQPAGAGSNAAITAGIGSGFVAVPRISIEGKRFDIIVDSKRETMMTQDQEGNAVHAQGLNVIIVGGNAGKYKAWFGVKMPDGSYQLKKWQPGQDAERPACYSYDGERPSPLSDVPQSETCAACPHNVWGSAINELGNKTRACTDSKLLAVIPTSAVKMKAAPDSANGRAFQIKVSATALSRSREDRKDNPAGNTSLSEYVAMLNNYPVEGGNVEVPVRSVVTRLFFGNAQYPLLQFKLAKQPWLTEEEMAYVEERANGEDIKMIVTEQGVPEGAVARPVTKPLPPPPAAPALAAPATPAAAPAAPAPAEAPAPKPRGRKPVAAATAAAPPPVAAVDEEDEENEVFVAAQPAAAQAAPAKPATPPAQPTGAALDDALGDIANLFGN